MSLAADRRGRVPFALVGVVLLVSASVYAGGVMNQDDPAVDQAVAEAVDATSRDVRPALRTAVRDAARDASRHPVTNPADTPTGRVLNDSSPFVDALRVRIAVSARSALAELGRRTDGARTTASLPPIDDVADLRTAKRDVVVTPVEGGAAMTVTVRNVSLSAHRDGLVVAERRLNVTLTVRTPVLALHDRARNYEQRLNRGPLDGPGLGRGVTARLYPVTAARAYARYSGAPIRNVLGNRHVELSTNSALLAQQRAVFGQHDPAGARALEVATVRVGVTDLLATKTGATADWTDTVLRPNAVDDGEQAAGRFAPETPDAPPVASSPNAAADEAYLGVSADLDEVTAGSYQVDGELRTRVLDRVESEVPEPSPPGENWTLLIERTSNKTVVTAADSGERPDATVTATRRVIVRHTTTRIWVNGDERRVKTVEWAESTRVAVAVTTAYAPDDAAPERPTVPLFEEGGAIGGPNLAGSRHRVARELLADNGGIDTIAARVAAGEAETLTQEATITAERPETLKALVAADLRELRRTVANVSVNVSRERVAAGEANPAALLAERLQERRTALVDAPGQYDGAADRARVAARNAYLDRVIAALQQRAAATKDRNRDYRDEVGDGVARRLAKLVSVGNSQATARSPQHGGPEQRGSDAELRIVPDGSPAYLTMTAVDQDHVPTMAPGQTVHPLAVRTTNWFALPYGEAAEGIAGALFGTKRVSLATAAGTLVAANRTVADANSGETDDFEERSTRLAENREALTAAVSRSVARAEHSACDAAGKASELPRRTCRNAVRDLRELWPGVGHRGLAMSNGSYADAFAAALEARGVKPATATDAGIRVGVRLREVTAERRTGVPAETTNQTATATRQVARQAVEFGSEEALERAGKRLTGASRLPAGLPLAPPPYTWVATVNAWSVTIRGEYQRFALRATAGGGVVRYIRDGSVVHLDVDDDGDPERLGRNERIGFETETTVVAAVPPGPPGVGDVDGTRTERSNGWPCPGAEREADCVATVRDPE
jgi:ribosomal protein S9